MGYSLPGSFVYGILQARIRELPVCGLPCPPPGDLPDPGISYVSFCYREETDSDSMLETVSLTCFSLLLLS